MNGKDARRGLRALGLAAVLAALTLVAAGDAAARTCGADSDCAGFGKCSNGECGGCGADSDCNGHGKCSSGRCGSCGADSDCAVGKCSSGRCGACGADSDCHGGRCSSGRCSNALSSTGPLTGAALRAALAEVVSGTRSCAAR